MQHFDLAIGWEWEYDEPFVRALEREAQSKRRLSTYSITSHNVEHVAELVKRGGFRVGSFLDRAFDNDERFEQLGKALERRGTHLINGYKQTAHATDKATMHLEFINAGLHVPFSIIISPYSHVKEIGLTLEDIAHLGRPFVIKPANTTGGSIGVVTGAETLIEVLETRQELEEDKYLLQEKIYPRVIEGRRAWFRCFFVNDKVFLAWWDDTTHIYAPVTPEDEHYYHLRPLRTIMRTIAKLAGLNFFSTEIALREASNYEPSRFVVVDYVNDMCDMRTIDIAHDGLPNGLFQSIVDRLALGAAKVAKGK